MALLKLQIRTFCYILVILLWISAPQLSHAVRRYPYFRDQEENPGRQPLQMQRPFNIAHRGSNGEIPEETAEAYMVSFLRLCSVYLSSLRNMTNSTHFLAIDWTCRPVLLDIKVDFTLAEIKTLRARQRFPFRDQSYNGKYQIITFEEFIKIALNAERIVGIYPEIKSPVFVNKHVKWPGGKTHEDIFVETLLKFNYTGKFFSEAWKKQPLFIQSFAPTSLFRASNLTDSPLILLLDDVTVNTQDTNQTYAEITSDEYLKFISKYVVGLGPWKDTIVPPNEKNYLATPTDLIKRAHAHNLQVHPYTYRNENKFLHFDFHQDPYQEYRYWIHNMSVDGMFTDFTGTLHLYQEWTSPLSGL
ncbi:glycerophosphodiester phosphodiesterase GDPD5 isoform X2 [Physcomitrium patens]|uniref:glycerophosphodiester phosphodiesterase GDPD5 isoform X2 n=1 Tax=Physcomitrium patens TaxID=3218 RepID=UPI000D173E14|nr:glycerophosphodiester phosphodiesterase GDPD5-like isoform X2 [Physcomitrium patens]|eukprot:XP_024388126.1 glycerophosphodiester phosphodiesterase GDPD5-like isoform X2 [Physcomitrella patens]